MSNSSLQRYDNNGLELVIDQATGESFATVSGYARMVGLSRSAISRRLKNYDSAIKNIKISTPGGLQESICIDLNTILHWLVRDNPTAIGKVIDMVYQMTGNIPNTPSSTFIKKKTQNKQKEKKAQYKLAQALDGITEVRCKTGVIDILTHTEIIEVKKAESWKHAVGQVLIYQLEYADKNARIHLVGECSEEFKHMVISFASRLNIVATFEN